MTKDETPGVIVCMPRLPGIYLAPGCTDHKCAFCTRILGVSPSAQGLLADGAFPICPVCMLVNAKPDNHPQFHPAIREEIEQHSGMTPEQIMGSVKPNDAVAMLADRITMIEGKIERGEIGG